jgi:hypothetical protein
MTSAGRRANAHNVEGSNMKIKTRVRAGAISDRCGGTRCGGSSTYKL